MEPLRHDQRNHYVAKQPVGWAAVNRPADRTDADMDPVFGGPVALHGSTTTVAPVVRPEGSSVRTAVEQTSRPLQPLLPRPLPVFKVVSNPKPCLVCGRPSCTLSSHRFFADKNLSKRRPRSQGTHGRAKPPMRSSLSAQVLPMNPSDQFVQYPIIMDGERHELLSLWSREWSRTTRGPERHLFPLRLIDRVLQTAKAHAALFQALLATSGSMCELAGGALGDAAVRNLQLADQILTQTCTTQAAASRDECLLAALLLASVYQARGNHHETDQRFSSIVRLVHSRGGPHYLGISGAVADLLLHVDYLQAVLLDCEPVWKLPLPALDMGISPRLGGAFRGLVSSNTFNADLLQAADSMCRATDMFEQPVEAMSPATVNAFGYLSSIAEYQLAHCNAVFHGSATWDECICLALLLFNYTVLRHDGAITAPMRKIERQFWRTVDDTITRSGFRDVPPCLLLWIFITGLSVCVHAECDYRGPAVSRMRAAKISAAITGWEHFQQQVLDDFVWMRATHEAKFRDIWLEVEGYRIMS